MLLTWSSDAGSTQLMPSLNWLSCQVCASGFFCSLHLPIVTPILGPSDPLWAPSAAQVSRHPHCEVGEEWTLMDTLLHTLKPLEV